MKNKSLIATTVCFNTKLLNIANTSVAATSDSVHQILVLTTPYMGDSDAATRKLAKKVEQFQLHPASGLQQISVHTGIWMPIAASETPVLTGLNVLATRFQIVVAI